jgi:hypothetical protein
MITGPPPQAIIHHQHTQGLTGAEEESITITSVGVEATNGSEVPQPAMRAVHTPVQVRVVGEGKAVTLTQSRAGSREG